VNLPAAQFEEKQSSGPGRAVRAADLGRQKILRLWSA
jgi:hypothetical protein